MAMHELPEGPSGPGGDAPILVVEDDPQLRLTMELALLDEGNRVETAADGLAAVERARTRRPALVLLDWGLPLLTGQEVAEAIHQSYAETVPIVLVTADGRSAEKARLARAREYLDKPFDLDHLIDTVRRTLQPS